MPRPAAALPFLALRSVLGAVALLALWGMLREAMAGHFDYLYVEANEADSSGGHAAIRFKDRVFHFTHENGILRLHRADSAVFAHAYRVLGNRAIHEKQVAVSEETYDLLRDSFARLYHVQNAQIDRDNALRRDVELLGLVLKEHNPVAGEPAGASWPVKGLGYFLPPPGQLRDAPSSPAIKSLRDRVRAAYGERFIEERIALVRDAIRRLELRAAEPSVTALSPDLYPPSVSSVSTRYTELLQNLSALEVLLSASPLRPGTFWTPRSDLFILTPADARVLKGVADLQKSILVSLAGSRRSDWGLPFLVGMARLAAIEASLSSGQMVFLDIFPSGEARDDASLRHYLPAIETEMRELFLRRRDEFFGAGAQREADYAALERSANLLLEVSRAMTSGTPLRQEPDLPYPAREAEPRELPFPIHDPALLARERERAREVESKYFTTLRHAYSYNLVGRNCVTEIFAVINRAMRPGQILHGVTPAADAPPSSEREESMRRLGGFVDSGRGLTFIPFVSALAVEDRYVVSARHDLPSYRSERLAAMLDREAPLAVFFRESNTITSTIYRPGPADSSFLFFTDDTFWLRPPFGAANLLFGTGEALLGLTTSPFLGSDRLLAGVKGVLFSLPELFFINVRKGTFAYVEQPSPQESPSRPPKASLH